ncbi:MAG: hypothetical protein ABII82_11190 [Verrucomicrobiota bacterium]
MNSGPAARAEGGSQTLAVRAGIGWIDAHIDLLYAMKSLHLALITLLLVAAAPLAQANIGQKGREKHHEMNDAVIEHRENKAEAKAAAEAKGEEYIEKCPDLVIKKGKRTIVIKCGDAKRNNPDCPLCGVNAQNAKRDN